MQLHLFDASEITARTQALLAPFEGFESKAYWDGASPVNRPTIGLGFNLEAPSTRDYLILVLQQVYGPSTINISAFVTDFDALMQSSGFRPSLSQYLQNKNFHNNQLQTALDNLVAQNLLPGASFAPLTLVRPQADTIERQILEGYSIGGVQQDGKFARLQRLLFDNNQINIQNNTDEFVALASLYYNSESLIGEKLLSALRTDNRAEAWYQIRYESNKERITNPALARGIANRRYAESDTFGLYENATLTDAEAKSIFRMYTEHRESIYTYESDTRTSPSLTNSFVDESQPARNRLITAFTGFSGAPTIDGEVLVGNEELRGDVFDVRSISIPGVPSSIFDLSKNDLLFGEGGRDTLHGQGGADVLYGGAGGDDLYGEQGNDFLFGEAGEDTLQGGADNDVLEGGADRDTLVGGTGVNTLRGGSGKDRYVSIGTDTIEDSDNLGSVEYSGKVLTGGSHRAGDPSNVYRSADGTITLTKIGNDLVVTGSSTLTIKNFDFMNGMLGITLKESPTIVTTAPSTTRTIVGDFDPLDTDPNEPGVQIDYDELGNILQDTESPNDRSDIFNGSASNDTINGGAMNDRLTALGGSDILTGGSDNDILIGQDGNDQLFADQLVNVSSLSTFVNYGGTIGTGANGDFLTGGVNDDVLVGGAEHEAGALATACVCTAE